MATDLNRLMADIRNSREVFVTEDGGIEDADEARANAVREEQTEGAPKPRTRLKPEIFGGEPPEVRVRASVIDAMHAEAHRHAGETGGILVGPEPRHVTELIPSGPDARRSGASYELDVEHLQPLLRNAEDRGLAFLGIWHSHPEGFNELSATDRTAARSILRDPDWNVTELLLPLSVRRGKGFETSFFLADGDDATIRSLRLILSSGTKLCAATTEGPWAFAGSFADTPYGKARLCDDKAQLEAAGWKVTAKHGQSFLLVVERADVTLYLLLPREYPFSPPDVLRTESERVAVVDARKIPELAAWSSRRSLVEIADRAALAPVGPRRDRPHGPVFRILSRAILRGRRMLVGGFKVEVRHG